MLTLILWLLALYGAVIAVWNILMAVWNKNQVFKTGVHAVVLMENAADYVEGCIDPLLKGYALLRRELVITTIDLQSQDDTLPILNRLSKENEILNVQTSTEQEAIAWITDTLANTNQIVCILDLRKMRDPREIVAAVSSLCGK